MYAGEIHDIPYEAELHEDADAVGEMRRNLENGDVYILRQAYPREFIERVREYLTHVARHSLAAYHPIEEGAPNHHRVNWWDPRSYVKGCFHQFSFFPWNQDVFNLFERFREGYYLKNVLNNLPKEKYLGMAPEDGCTARLSFQFYPKGIGALHKHQDPVGAHQLTVPMVAMSKKGFDFFEGGSYLEREDGQRIVLDDIAEPGDLIQCNGTVHHGVDTIDPQGKEDWLSFEGRWILILAVNAVAGNTRVDTSVDLETVSSS